jgi:hypothetical protein
VTSQVAARDPAHLLLGIFLGGRWLVCLAGRGWDGDGDEWRWSGGPNLVLLLVLFAGVAHLFTTRCPRGSFEYVLGLDRWVLRVIGYAALMTDAYPPFRLAQGRTPHPWLPKHSSSRGRRLTDSSAWHRLLPAPSTERQ